MSSLNELMTQIFSDLMTPISYIPYGIMIAFIYIGIIMVLKRFKFKITKNLSKERIIKISIFITYITVVLITAFFSRESGSRTGIDLQLFSILGVSTGEDASFIENIIMLSPMGFLLCALYNVFRRGIYCVIFGMSLSIFLETAQLITGRGYCQLDDVFTNTIGTAIGYILYKCYSKLSSIKYEKVYLVRNISY